MDRVPLKKMGQKMKKKKYHLQKKEAKKILLKHDLKKYVKCPKIAFPPIFLDPLTPNPLPSIPFNNTDREDIEVSLTLK